MALVIQLNPQKLWHFTGNFAEQSSKNLNPIISQSQGKA
jgi:hypothetical protein